MSAGKIRSLKARIDMLNSTVKVTKSMKLISSIKMKNAINLLTNYNILYENINNAYLNIAQQSIYSDLFQSGRMSKYYKSNGNIKNTLYIPISANRGLCGGINSAIIKHLENLIHQNNENFSTLPLGKVISKYCNRHYLESNIAINNDELLNYVISNIHEYDSIVLIYNHFISPLQYETKNVEIKLIETKVAASANDNMLFNESQIDEIISFLQTYIQLLIKYYICHANASEYSSSMLAMDSATKNAESSKAETSLQINKLRQSIITNEIINIISGMEAL